MVGSFSKVYYVHLCVVAYKQNVDELSDHRNDNMRKLFCYDSTQLRDIFF